MPRNTRLILGFGAAVLTMVAVLIVISVSGGESEDTDPQPAATVPANVRTATTSATTPSSGAGGQEDVGTPTLVAGETELLPLPGGGLAGRAGEQVRGSRLVVVAVEDDGFYVARRAGDRDRVFVEHDSSYAPRKGDTVDVRGTLERADGDDPGAEQGAEIDADSVVPQGTGGGSGDADPQDGELHP